MENKMRMKTIHVSLFYLVILTSYSQCSNKDCFRLQILPSQESILGKGAPVILDDGIVGYVDGVQTKDGKLMAKFCLPPAIQIPRNSKVYVGFIQAFSVYGIKIVTSTESEFINSSELLYGLSMDSIDLELPPTDTALTDKLIDIVNDVNKKNKERNE
jgi:hypothetical protein